MAPPETPLSLDAPDRTELEDRTEADRPTLGGLWNDFAGRFLHLERGLAPTIRDMTVRPGHVVESYIRGERRRYLNPLGFLVLGTAANVVVAGLSGSYEDFSQWLEADYVAKGIPVDEAVRLHDVALWIFEHTIHLYILTSVAFAVLARLVYGRRRLTVAEGLILSLYCMAQVMLIAAAAEVPFLLFSDGAIPVSLGQLVGYCSMFVVFGLAAYQALGHSVRAVTLSWIALTGALAVQAAAGALFAMLWVSHAEVHEPWTLYRAVDERRPVLVRHFLDRDDIEVDAAIHRTPLHAAATHGDVELAELLLERGAAVDVRDERGRTPLALGIDHPDLVELLLRRGADPTLVPDDGTPLLERASDPRSIEALRLALDGRASVDRSDDIEPTEPTRGD